MQKGGYVPAGDGSTINNVQIVVDLANFDEELLKQITTGACLSVNGILVESVGAGQAAEIQAREIEILGACDNTSHICVRVPIHLGLYSASVTIWRLLSISSFTNAVFSISIHR